MATLADELHSLVEKFGLAQGKAACRWFRAWADARQGKPEEAFQQIRAAYEENTALGMIAGGSETLGYAAEALILNGDCDGAEEQLRQAFDIVSTRGERIYLPQLFLAGPPSHAHAASSRRLKYRFAARSWKRRNKDPSGWSCSPSALSVGLERNG